MAICPLSRVSALVLAKKKVVDHLHHRKADYRRHQTDQKKHNDDFY